MAENWGIVCLKENLQVFLKEIQGITAVYKNMTSLHFDFIGRRIDYLFGPTLFGCPVVDAVQDLV